MTDLTNYIGIDEANRQLTNDAWRDQIANRYGMSVLKHIDARQRIIDEIVRANYNIPNLRTWALELLTTNHLQVKEYLHKGDGYCCLGIQAELAGVVWKEHPYDRGPGGAMIYQDSVSEGCSLPNNQQMEWLGELPHPEQGITQDGTGIDLGAFTVANDEAGMSFAQISEAITAGIKAKDAAHAMSDVLQPPHAMAIDETGELA